MSVTAWLRAFLAALPLPHLSLAVTVGGVHHHGDIVTAAADEDCDCEVDPDAGQRVLVVLPIDSAADLFEEAIRRHGNGGDPEEVAWEMARALELGGDVA